MEFTDTFSNKLKLTAAAMLIVACLIALPFLPHILLINPPAKASVSHPTVSAGNSSLDNSPNAITRGVFQGADGLGRISDSTGQAISKTSRSATSFIFAAVTNSGRFAAHALGSGVGVAARAVSSGFKFIVGGTSQVVGSITSTSFVGIVIRPADNAKSQVPVIDSQLAALYSAQTFSSSNEPNEQEIARIDSEAAWPIHGRVTTKFGVPHRPYQETHTGIDISSGKPSGVTPVKSFKPGRVANIAYSRIGLGNHLVVDHGGGITSVYAHLASISVRVGQEVSKNTTLGYEGSTGASTGTHLHFEIRLNGNPVDPKKYIDGLP